MYKYIFFADGTNLLCYDRNVIELVCVGLEKLQTWFSVNRLTHYVFFLNT